MRSTSVPTLLLCRLVTCDALTQRYTACGITEVLPLNRASGTNDWHDVLIEFEPALSSPGYLEIRVAAEDGVDIYRGKIGPPSALMGKKWLAVSLPSLPENLWVVGQTYGFEIWTKDDRLARREFKCVLMDDIEPPVH